MVTWRSFVDIIVGAEGQHIWRLKVHARYNILFGFVHTTLLQQMSVGTTAAW